jgi:carbamate kinase
MSKPILVAIGGNSLIRATQRGTIDEQRANARLTADHLARLIARGERLVLTHGNGPQVGADLLRSEAAAAQTPPVPLDVCDAATQGEIGYILAQALRESLRELGIDTPIAAIVTQVVVDADDPAFERPTKPIGPFYDADESRRRERDLGWTMIEDARRGFRRVVPSPEPLEIVEIDAIRRLSESGVVVIAAGGGGIPVARRDRRFTGVEAVIDKDRAAALLARELGADTLLISTDVPQVYLGYGQPDQTPLTRLTPAEARRHLADGHFPAGSMGPKIEAALRFLDGGDRAAIITSPEHMLDALDGSAGTRIVADESRGDVS